MDALERLLTEVQLALESVELSSALSAIQTAIEGKSSSLAKAGNAKDAELYEDVAQAIQDIRHQVSGSFGYGEEESVT